MFILFHRVLLDPALCATLEGGALLAFGAFEKPGPVFSPTPSTPDPKTIRDALNTRDANEWRAAMNTEIEKYASLIRLHSSPTSSQHEYHHATIGFPQGLRAWLTRQTQGTPHSTRVCPGLRCLL